MRCQEAFKTNEVDLYELTWEDLQGILIGKKSYRKIHTILYRRRGKNLSKTMLSSWLNATVLESQVLCLKI